MNNILLYVLILNTLLLIILIISFYIISRNLYKIGCTLNSIDMNLWKFENLIEDLFNNELPKFP